MAAYANVTVTSVAGPGLAVTSQVFNNVTDVDFQLGNGTIALTLSDGRVFSVSYSPVATVTYTISGSVATIAIS
jgi:hypothetical protein